MSNRGVIRRCEFIIGVGEMQGQKCNIPFTVRGMVGNSLGERFCEDHRGVSNNPRGKAGLYTGSNKRMQSKNAEIMQEYLVDLMANSYGDADAFVTKENIKEYIQQTFIEIFNEYDEKIEALKAEHEKLQEHIVTLSNRITRL